MVEFNFLSVEPWMIFPIITLAALVPFMGLDGVWLLNFVAGIFSAAAAVVVAKRGMKTIGQ